MFIIVKKNKELSKKKDTSGELEIKKIEKKLRKVKSLKVKKKQLKKKSHKCKKRKKRKKIYRYGRLQSHLVAGIMNIVALVGSIVFLVAFFVPKFKLVSFTVMLFTIMFTLVLVCNIFALYYSRNSQISLVGPIMGILSSLVMISYPSLGFFLAIVLYGGSLYWLFKKQRYLVVPKKRRKPIYQQPLLMVAVLAALALGGAQAAFALNNKEETQTSKTVAVNKKPKKQVSKKKSVSSESQSSTSKTEETTSTSTEESSQREESSESTEEKPVEKTYEPVGIGQEQTIEQLVIKVTEIKEQMELRPQNNLESGPDELIGMAEEQIYQPVEGAKFLLIYLNTRNTSEEALFFSQNDVMLVGQSGEEYYGIPVFGVEGFMENVNLEPNTEAGGFVVFEIPGDVAVQTLQMRYIGMFAPENGIVSFNLQ